MKQHPDLVVGNAEHLERRQWRRLGARSHIDPHHAGALDRAVRLGADPVLEVLLRRHVRHVDALAGDVEFPAVIDAAQPVRLVAAEKQRRAAVRAAVIHHADQTSAVAKRDQLLAEQHQTKRRAAAGDLRRHQCGNPIFPHQLAHDGTRADARQLNAIARRRHAVLPMPVAAMGAYDLSIALSATNSAPLI